MDDSQQLPKYMSFDEVIKTYISNDDVVGLREYLETYGDSEMYSKNFPTLSLLHYCPRERAPGCATLLMERGCSYSSYAGIAGSPILLAIHQKQDHYECLKQIIHYHGPECMKEKMMHGQRYLGKTYLEIAEISCTPGDYDIILKIMEDASDMNMKHCE